MALYLESLCRYEAVLKIMALCLTQSTTNFFENLTTEDLLYIKKSIRTFI